MFPWTASRETKAWAWHSCVQLDWKSLEQHVRLGSICREKYTKTCPVNLNASVCISKKYYDICKLSYSLLKLLQKLLKRKVAQTRADRKAENWIKTNITHMGSFNVSTTTTYGFVEFRVSTKHSSEHCLWLNHVWQLGQFISIKTRELIQLKEVIKIW